MKLNKFKTVLSVGVLSLLVLAGLSQTAAAQHDSQWAHEKNRVRKEQKQHEKALKRREKCYRVYREGNYYQTDYPGGGGASCCARRLGMDMRRVIVRARSTGSEQSNKL